MVNIVLIERNEIECRKIINKIQGSERYKKIRKFYDIKEATQTLNKNNFDIVILDERYQNIPCVDFFDMLGDNFRNKKLFIIISNSKILCIIQNKKNFIYYKWLKFDEIESNITNFFKEDDNIIIKKIEIELKKLNFNFLHVGTTYLIRTVYEVFMKNNRNNINLSKDIFPIVGKKFNKNPNTIHSGIKKVVINMYFDCEEAKLKKYFKYYHYVERPRLKEIIFKIIEKIE